MRPEEPIDLTDTNSSDADSDSESVSSSSSSDSSSSSGSSVTRDDLAALLEQCRKNADEAQARIAEQKEAPEAFREDDLINLEDDSAPLPPLDPGPLPPPYLDLEDKTKGSSSLKRKPFQSMIDVDGTPAPPIPPPELTKSGRPLTKKERKASKQQTAGPDWYDLPAPSPAQLPALYREVESLRLRNQLDPKRFYRKEEGEGKGVKGLPKYFAIGTMVDDSSPFTSGGTSSTGASSSRKRTMVDDLIDDAEAKRYAKKKFNELQRDRGAKGRNTLQAKMAQRRQKW